MATGTIDKRCSRCGEAKPLSEFHKHAGRKDGRTSICKTCAAIYARSDTAKAIQQRYARTDKRKAVKSRYYERHRERLRVMWRADQTRRRQQARAWLNAIKLAAGCADCGYNKHPAALDFDHIGTDKTANVGVMVRSRVSRAIVEAEIAKCEVVCANCHRIRTYERGQHSNGKMPS
jgi:hypothetical protein